MKAFDAITAADVRAAWRQAGFGFLYVYPACATDLFQPCDQGGVNLKFKAQMKKGFEAHFHAELKRHMESGKEPSTFVLDQRLTALRTKNHEWTANCWRPGVPPPPPPE